MKISLKERMFKKKIIIISAIIATIILLPYLFVETNTVLFGENFENEYKQTYMISNIEYYKVFYCVNGRAKVYYVDENHESGNFVWFEKRSGDWIMKKWDTVWSEYGGASGITFPYYR